MQILMAMLLFLMTLCAIAVSATRKLLPAVIIFMSYSMIMSVVWLLLRAPDLAITGYRGGRATPIFVNGTWAEGTRA